MITVITVTQNGGNRMDIQIRSPTGTIITMCLPPGFEIITPMKVENNERKEGNNKDKVTMEMIKFLVTLSGYSIQVRIYTKGGNRLEGYIAAISKNTITLETEMEYGASRTGHFHNVIIVIDEIEAIHYDKNIGLLKG